MQPTQLFHSTTLSIRDLPGITAQPLSASWTADGPVRCLFLHLNLPVEKKAMIVPSLSVTGIGPYAFRFSITIGGVRQTMLPMGDESLWPQFPPGQMIADDNVKAAIDTDHIDVDTEWIGNGDIEAAKILFACCVLRDGTVIDNQLPAHCLLNLPPVSQMEQPDNIGSRICSPTCVTMALRHFNIAAEPMTVAQQAYHAGMDLYGVWPMAIYAASLYGVHGFVSGVASLTDIAPLAQNGYPLIASISYAQNALTGSAIAKTAGHLVAVCGVDGEKIVVNDPAAADAESVRRSYDAKEFIAAWQTKRGLSYILIK